MSDRKLHPVQFLWISIGVLSGAGAYELVHKLIGWGDPHSTWTDGVLVAVFCFVGGAIGLVVRSGRKPDHA